jgi:hypothetical protein
MRCLMDKSALRGKRHRVCFPTLWRLLGAYGVSSLSEARGVWDCRRRLWPPPPTCAMAALPTGRRKPTRKGLEGARPSPFCMAWFPQLFTAHAEAKSRKQGRSHSENIARPPWSPPNNGTPDSSGFLAASRGEQPRACVETSTLPRCKALSATNLDEAPCRAAVEVTRCAMKAGLLIREHVFSR